MYGFRMDVNTVGAVGKVLADARARVQERADALYAEWLASICAEACDRVALGTMPRPQDRLLLDVARDELAGRVSEAKALSLPVSYNTRVQGHVLENDGRCYLRLVYAGPELLQALRETPGLVDVSIPDASAGDSVDAGDFPGDPEEWRAVFAAYDGGTEPGWYDLSPALDPYAVEPGEFPPVAERADVLARRCTVEEYLAKVSRGQTIPPADLMRRIDEATEYALSGPGTAATAARKSNLVSILVDLAKHPEVVFGDQDHGVDVGAPSEPDGGTDAATGQGPDAQPAGPDTAVDVPAPEDEATTEDVAETHTADGSGPASDA